MKELVLKGVADVCNSGKSSLDKIKQLHINSGIELDLDLEEKIQELEFAIEIKDTDLATLNKAWEAFIPENKVIHTDYGYDYCSAEPLIKAYIMDGFSYVCGLAEEMLDKIDDLQGPRGPKLDVITTSKIEELGLLLEEYEYNATEVESLWDLFVSQEDTLYYEYPTTDIYCDNIHQVKDWVMHGLVGSCEEGIQYLQQIEQFQETFKFNFTEDLECRVTNLRFRVWNCRYQALKDLAVIETSEDGYQDRLNELMTEYGVGERPEVCDPNE